MKLSTAVGVGIVVVDCGGSDGDAAVEVHDDDDVVVVSDSVHDDDDGGRSMRRGNSTDRDRSMRLIFVALWRSSCVRWVLRR